MRNWLWVLLMGAVFPLFSRAQRPLYDQSRRTALEQLSRQFHQDRNEAYRRAVRIANRRKIPLWQQRSDGTVVILQGVDERGNLLFNKTESATQAANTTHTSALYAGGSLGLSLSGAGPAVQNRLGIWDGGGVLTTHTEFGGRVTQADKATKVDNHATHVAGILVSAGLNTRARGMAFGATLKAYDFSNDKAEMASAASNLLVSNHSYGTEAGWVYNADRAGDVKWEWWGDTTISALEDYKFGIYNSEARDWDRIAYNAPNYLIVKSAGNAHGQNGPGAGNPYYLANYKVASRTNRASQNGYDQLSTSTSAKNVLVVGSVATLPNDYAQPSDVKIASFSSWGPTDDGRIKPDLVGVGVNVLSTSSAGPTAYATLSGTSMSSPNVAGSLLLLQEYYAQLNNGQSMRSSTLRGLALHTTNEAGEAPGPDYRYGWGLLNTERAARVLGNINNNHRVAERTLNGGETYTLSVVASGRGPLVATLCWTDPEGTGLTASAANLNNRSPRLVNDLDVRISDGSQTRLPWTLDPANPTNPATPGDNIRDNVEQILVVNPVPGKSYTVTVTHKGTLRNGRQEYALLLSGIGGKAYCASSATSAGPVQIDRVRFGAIDQKGNDGCQAYSDFTAVVTGVSSGQAIPLVVDLGSCGTSRPSITKAFVDWNGDGDFEDRAERLATSAVLTSPATFSATVTIPGGLTTGQTTRLRIVTVETADSNAVQACGNYLNGETEDYTIRFDQPQNDVGISAILSPTDGFCVRDELVVAARLKNYGTADQQNIPVVAQITAPFGSVVATLQDTLRSVLGAGQEGQLLLRGTASLKPGSTYRLSVLTRLPTDQEAGNNAADSILTTAANSDGQATLSAAQCGDGPVFLRNTGNGTASWYDAPTGGTPLAIGNSVSTPVRKTVYYAALNDLSATVGPTGKQAFGGGTYAGNFGPQPLVTTAIPLVLESARLYIGNAGRLTFSVQKRDGTVVASTAINVTPTRNPATPAGNPPAGQLADDPNDPGAEYLLNLAIPEPGDYKLVLDYEGGATIFRSNAGVRGFPFTLPGVIALKGAAYQNGTTTDTLTNAYYYLYNLKVRSLGCQTTARTAVTVSTGTATEATVTAIKSTTLCPGDSVLLRALEGQGYTYQWYRDGQIIAGATTSALSATATGAYAVQVTGNCGPVLSAVVNVLVQDLPTPTITLDGNVLTSSVQSDNQWLLNGVPVVGATQPTYVATQSGRYAVRVSALGCGEVVSPEVAVDLTAIPMTNVQLLIAPNPASQFVTIVYTPVSKQSKDYTVVLTDERGIRVRSALLKLVNHAFTHTFSLVTLQGGLFFVHILDEKGQTVDGRKLLKL